MKKLFFAVILFAAFSCSDVNKRSVKYISTGAISAYNLQYLDANGEMIKTDIVPQSAQDKYSYGFMAEDGDIVYISGNYKDINSALKIMILVDGKIYKQAQSISDTLSFLTVSGTIPY